MWGRPGAPARITPRQRGDQGDGRDVQGVYVEHEATIGSVEQAQTDHLSVGVDVVSC